MRSMFHHKQACLDVHWVIILALNVTLAPSFAYTLTLTFYVPTRDCYTSCASFCLRSSLAEAHWCTCI